ncbi:MAG: type II toxin-antitoxin system VapC family toxin [SAR324 cluster bacterium]|nr:type II toxin-antitoxin system VapC family toxin [SAR324 cluster bacterium]
MIICDTNILIEFYKENDSIIHELKRLGTKELGISAVSQAELYFGAINKTEFRQIKRHLSMIQIFPISVEISNKFIQLMEKYSLSHKLSLPDALIASTSIIKDLELYTLNVRDFQFIEGLKLYQPEKEQ